MYIVFVFLKKTRKTQLVIIQVYLQPRGKHQSQEQRSLKQRETNRSLEVSMPHLYFSFFPHTLSFSHSFALCIIIRKRDFRIFFFLQGSRTYLFTDIFVGFFFSSLTSISVFLYEQSLPTAIFCKHQKKGQLRQQSRKGRISVSQLKMFVYYTSSIF